MNTDIPRVSFVIRSRWCSCNSKCGTTGQRLALQAVAAEYTNASSASAAEPAAAASSTAMRTTCESGDGCDKALDDVCGGGCFRDGLALRATLTSATQRVADHR